MILLPEYKKKSKRILSTAPKAKKTQATQNVSYKKETNKNVVYKTSPNELKVVKGRKLAEKRKMRIGATAFAVIIALFFIFEITLPVGINDSLENFFATLGSGEFPIELSGTDLVDSKSSGGYFYALSDTSLSTYNASGKEIYTFAHGYENPIIKKSSTRVIVFEQGGKNAAIFNLSEQKSKIKLQNEIITANISRCGVYAIATHSDRYASTVSVFDRNDKLIYEWYSAENIVNNLVISPNGKKIAVSTINAKGGEFVSKVEILKFDTANSVYTADFKSNVILSLDSSHNGGFWCVCENFVKFIKWTDYEHKEFTTDYNISAFKADSGGAIAVFNRLNDKTDNKVVLFNKNGVKKSEFKFAGSISDISLVSGHIYLISDNIVYLLDKDGKISKSAPFGFGGEKIFVVSTYDVAVLNDSNIEKIHLK